jgi:YD repeat-containing protein
MQRKVCIGLWFVLPVLVVMCTRREVSRQDQMKYSVTPAQIERPAFVYNQSQRTWFGLRGNVHSVETNWYTATEENNTIVPRPMRVGSVMYQHEWLQFNTQGQLIEQKLGDNSADTAELRLRYVYDDANRLVSFHYQRNAGTANTIRYTYSAAGRMVVALREWQEGKPMEERYVYDNDRFVSVRGYYDAQEMTRRNYQLDDQGHILHYGYYNPPTDSQAVYQVRFTYTANGQHATEEEVEKDGQVSRTIRYQYDDDGLCMRAEVFDQHGRRVGEERYAYVLDKQGNWTRKVIYILGKPWIMAERKIQYYPKADPGKPEPLAGK